MKYPVWTITPKFGEHQTDMLWAPGETDLAALEVPRQALVAAYLPGLCRSLNALGITAEEATADRLNDILAGLLVTVASSFERAPGETSVRVAWLEGMDRITDEDLEMAQRLVDRYASLKGYTTLQMNVLQTKALLLIARSLEKGLNLVERGR
jgi:hypothetical protein